MTRIANHNTGATGYSREIKMTPKEPISKALELQNPLKKFDVDPSNPPVISESRDEKRESARQKARLMRQLFPTYKQNANRNSSSTNTRNLTAEDLERLATPPNT